MATPQEPVTQIVIWIRKGIASIGIQANATDPEFVSVASDDLDEVLARIPDFLSQAQQKWASEPRRPAALPSEPKTKARNRQPQHETDDSDTQGAKPRLF